MGFRRSPGGQKHPIIGKNRKFSGEAGRNSGKPGMNPVISDDALFKKDRK
jgi:hypothetical protein